MTTLEGNILIEKFMYPNEIIGKYRADMLIYHVSWNELMKVVIAIEERADGENQIDIFGNCVKLGGEEFIEETKIEVVWEAVTWWCRTNCP